MAGTSIHTLTKTENGVQIKIHRPHTVQDRLDAACSKIVIEYSHNKKFKGTRKEKPLDRRVLESVGMIEFYRHENTYISISSAYHEYVFAKIKEFINELITPTAETIPNPPNISEPTNFLDDDDFLLEFDEFLFSDKTAAQEIRNESNNYYTVKTLLQEKLSTFQIDTPYPRKDLINYINDKNLTAGITHKFLSKPKYGYYQINKTLYEE